MAANVLTASSLATDAVVEIQTGLSTLDAAGVRAAIGLASANIDSQLSTIDDYIDTEIAAIKTVVDAIEVDTQNLQSRIPAALVSGRIDASIGAMASNVVTAASVATDAVTEIQSGLATASALATVAGYLDTEIQTIINQTEAAAMRTALGLLSANLNTLLTKVMRYDETYTHTNTDTSEAATVAIVKV
jgi:hypothetical protein